MRGGRLLDEGGLLERKGGCWIRWEELLVGGEFSKGKRDDGC